MGVTGALFGARGQRQPAPETHIATTAGSRQLFRKAYLIEFYTGNASTPSDAFTFALPPESEELSYTQRKTEAKTFGGLHVDEYGIDAARITLSGSTVNQSLKIIYKGGGRMPKWLSGEDEIYHFRDLLKKHRSINSLQEPAKGKIIIYDLSKHGSAGVAAAAGNERGGNRIENYWLAFPGDFKISRSADRPFAYKYTFEFTGVPLKEGGAFASGPRPPDPSLGSGSLGLIREAMGALISAIHFVDGMASMANDVLEKADRVAALLRLLGNVMSHSSGTLAGLVSSAGRSAAGVIDGAAGAARGAGSAAALPRSIQLNVLNVGLELQNATGRLARAASAIAGECRRAFDEGGGHSEVPLEVLERRAMNNEEFKDSIAATACAAENAANELAAAAKSSAVPDIAAGNPDPATGEQRVVLSYGYRSVALKSTDCLESLAAEHLGDPDRAIDIAALNGAASVADLRPGDRVRIPVSRRTGSVSDNRVYARRGDRDNYGRDALLTDEGMVVPSVTGDYATVGGPRNLAQAVLLRLRESAARRIRLGAYGIRASVADPAAGAAYVMSSVDLTVSSDPRVASVDDIWFRAEGDALRVSVDYSDIDGSGGRAGGGV